jgi:hypothetical protein
MIRIEGALSDASVCGVVHRGLSREVECAPFESLFVIKEHRKKHAIVLR